MLGEMGEAYKAASAAARQVGVRFLKSPKFVLEEQIQQIIITISSVLLFSF